MNLKSKILGVFIICAIIISILIPNIVFAADSVLYLGITPMANNDIGYSIKEPGQGGKVIFNFLKYQSEQSELFEKQNIYCLNRNVGFGADSNTQLRATYNVSFDMKTQKPNIKNHCDVLKNIVEGTVDGNVSTYNALLALGDLLYLPGDSDDKLDYLNSKAVEQAKKTDSHKQYSYLIEQNPLTSEDVNAVQQAVIWYFTMYNGQSTNIFDETNALSWLWYTNDGGKNYRTLADLSMGRSYGADMLYNYLTETAKQNAPNYSNPSQTIVPAVLNTTSLECDKKDSNRIVGPINITENSNTIPYIIDFKVKNNNTEEIEYKLLNSNKEEVSKETTVKDLVGENFYISVPETEIQDLSISVDIKYSDTTLKLWTASQNLANSTQPVMIPERTQKDVTKTLTLNPESPDEFDLALRKYITKINGQDVKENRVPNISEDTVNTQKTATYKHRKDPVAINTGDKVTYNITIYNEGKKEGRATEIVDQLPTGLTFSKVINGNFEKKSDVEADNNRLVLKRKDSNTDNLPAYQEGNLASETIEIECIVTATPDTAQSKILTNVAWISEEYNAENNKTITNKVGEDRDSEPYTAPNVNKDNMDNYIGNYANKKVLNDKDYFYKGQQDDDDFEKLVLYPQAFDLKLIKRITQVNNNDVAERIKSIDVTNLNKLDSNGNLLVDTSSEKYTTAVYNLDKTPVSVKKGDIVTYTFRIYNEGTIDGYASEITEDIPEGLEFIGIENEDASEEEKDAYDFNMLNGWSYTDTTMKTIKTTNLALYPEINGVKDTVAHTENEIEAFGTNDGSKTKDDIHYKEISVKFKVIADNASGITIRNEAEISDDTDENGNPVNDRDSHTDIWKKYEDDEDFDNIILQSFDLALRKFITNINGKDVTTRIPEVKYENGKISYKHDKEPLMVTTENIVTYTIRIFNEGQADGYAKEITDDIPEGLEFLPDNKTNKTMRWKMIDKDGKETTNVEEAVKITTDYLSKEQESSEYANLINAFDSSKEISNTNPAYKDVKVAFKVTEPNSSDKILINSAQISNDSDKQGNDVDDIDSIPGQWNEGEDDQDKEYIKLVEFDLALRKWVTQAIVIENGNTAVTQTGHQPYDDPEGIVKVELNRKKLSQVTVKFKYSIRVINEGDIAGYAKEVTDYVPEGLKFVAQDNPGWTDKGDNVISTRLLENTLLQPGEHADIEVILTWINNEDNMGLKTNIAEISEDYNEYGVPDRDSTPNNKKTGEDDIDDAPVLLSINTGKLKVYFTIGFAILITIAGGVALIKKYVL